MPLTATPDRILQVRVDPQNSSATYTVTQSRIVLRDIILSRTDNVELNALVTISVVPQGETLSSKHQLYTKVKLRPYETLALSAIRPVVHTGDTIHIQVSDGFVNCYMSGGAYKEIV